MVLGDDDHFTNYHRLLNRARWSPWVLSKILLDLITKVFLPEGAPLLLVIDETQERRKGKKIKYKGWFRDPLRSTANHVSKSLGIRWVCLTISPMTTSLDQAAGDLGIVQGLSDIVYPRDPLLSTSPSRQ